MLFDQITIPENLDLIYSRGGGTFNNEGIEVSDYMLSGYLVGIESIIESWYSLDDCFAELSHHFWHPDYIDNYLGFWKSPDGYWYVDFVVHVDDYDTAMEIARSNFEDFIFDCQTGESLEVV